MKGLYYFAHPYTSNGLAEEANFRLCAYRSGRLIQAGYNVYSPIAHTHPIHVATPEFLQLPSETMWRMWCRLDNDFIARTTWTGLILAPGWEHSKGCTAERKIFEEQLQKPILLYSEIIGDD